MLVGIKQIIKVKDLVDFIETYKDFSVFKKAIEKWKDNFENRIGATYEEIMEKDIIYRFTDSDEEEIEKILEEAEGLYLFNYNKDEDLFEIYALDIGKEG